MIRIGRIRNLASGLACGDTAHGAVTTEAFYCSSRSVSDRCASGRTPRIARVRIAIPLGLWEVAQAVRNSEERTILLLSEKKLLTEYVFSKYSLGSMGGVSRQEWTVSTDAQKKALTYR